MYVGPKSITLCKASISNDGETTKRHLDFKVLTSGHPPKLLPKTHLLDEFSEPVTVKLPSHDKRFPLSST